LIIGLCSLLRVTFVARISETICDWVSDGSEKKLTRFPTGTPPPKPSEKKEEDTKPAKGSVFPAL